MVHLNIIEARLSHLGVRSSRWSKPELMELQHILVDGEEIISLANGRYFAGFATLVATDHRLLIIDKRPFFLTVEDIRYDMISELDYSSRLIDATLHIFTVNKQHRFVSYRHREHLRSITKYVQQRVMALRQFQQQLSMVTNSQQQMPEPPPPMPPDQTPPAPEPPPQAPEPPPRTYQKAVTHISGHALGGAAIQAAHNHWLSLSNPYTKASLMVRHSSGWLRSHTPHPEVNQILPQPEI
jgi:hypothetical protein